MARVNTTKAVEAWIKGQRFQARGRNGSPISTVGGILFSYSTPIGKWSDVDDNTAILNVEKYSSTTSTQQNGVRELLRQHGKRVILCDTAEQFRQTERA